MVERFVVVNRVASELRYDNQSSHRYYTAVASRCVFDHHPPWISVTFGLEHLPSQAALQTPLLRSTHSLIINHVITTS